jgi:hypothetical protein
MYHEPAEYFAAAYLCQRPEAEGIDVPRGVKECLSEIEEERGEAEKGSVD